MTNKRKLGTRNLLFGILFVLSALLVFFGEIISFTAYINNLQEQNSWEGLGIIVIIIFGLFAGIALLICATLQFVSAGILRAGKRNGKGIAITGAVFKFIAVVILGVYCALMFSYPAGYLLKTLYILFALITLLFGILDVHSLKTLNPLNDCALNESIIE